MRQLSTAALYGVGFCVLLHWLLLSGAQAQVGTPRRLQIVPDHGPLMGQTVYTNSFALLVGINRYPNLPARFQLEYARADALALREVLVRSYGFPAENIVTLLDEQATRENIRNALAWLTSKKRVLATDRLLLYFSSHGQAIDVPDSGKEGFLIPYDAKVDLSPRSDTLGYYQTCLPMRDLWAYVESCPARHSLVMVDACFGGLLTRSKGASVAEPALKKYLGQTAYEFLTAGGKNEEAWEDSALGHSVFMYSLLKELNKQAKEPDATFTAAELYATLKTDVTNKSLGKQTPQMESFGGSEGEVIFVSTRAQKVPPLTVGLPHGAEQEKRTPRVLAEEILSKSAESYFRKDYGQAERLMRQALQVEPSYAYAYYVLGGLYDRNKKDYVQAETFYRKAIALDPKCAPAYYNLGALCGNVKKDHAQSESLYKQAINADPNYAAAYVGLGNLCHLIKRDYVNAEMWFRKAIEINPTDATSYNNLGLVCDVVKKDYGQAESLYKKAVELNPKFAAAYFNLGVLFANVKQDYVQAEIYYKKAIDADPNYAGAYSNLALLQDVFRKDFAQAEIYHQKAIALDSQSASVHLYFAIHFFVQGKVEQAREEARKAKSLDVKNEFDETAKTFLRQLGL